MWLFVPDAITLFAHSSTIACASAWLWSAIEYVAALNRVNSKGTCADDFVHFELFPNAFGQYDPPEFIYSSGDTGCFHGFVQLCETAFLLMFVLSILACFPGTVNKWKYWQMHPF